MVRPYLVAFATWGLGLIARSLHDDDILKGYSKNGTTWDVDDFWWI